MSIADSVNSLFQKRKKESPSIDEGDLLRRNTEHFLVNFPVMFSYVYGQKPNILQKDTHWTNIQYKLNLQFLIEDVVTYLEKSVHAKLLYAFSSQKGKILQAVLYTLPTENDMTTFLLRSNLYGAVDIINITLFDDVMEMYHALKHDIDIQEQSSRHFLEKESSVDFIKDFI